ncbi:hypothetical protein AN958_02167 [Leucoagaricus sp. SymC.cos]|nr:hypothetical protein AN958_02167 [Leucoagaricus sp. SymC.cos]
MTDSDKSDGEENEFNTHMNLRHQSACLGRHFDQLFHVASSEGNVCSTIGSVCAAAREDSLGPLPIPPQDAGKSMHEPNFKKNGMDGEGGY